MQEGEASAVWSRTTGFYAMVSAKWRGAPAFPISSTVFGPQANPQLSLTLAVLVPGMDHSELPSQD